jgi:hypothetical protein
VVLEELAEAPAPAVADSQHVGELKHLGLGVHHLAVVPGALGVRREEDALGAADADHARHDRPRVLMLGAMAP